MDLLIYLFLLVGVPAVFILIDFIGFLFKGERLYNAALLCILDILAMVVLPVIYLTFMDNAANDCCDESAAFSPDHRLTIYVLIVLCILFYFISVIRDKIASPIVEVLINCFLLSGIALNIFIWLQAGMLGLVGNLPIIMLLLLQLAKSHKRFLKYNENRNSNEGSFYTRMAWRILGLNPFFRIPLLLILCLPLLIIITSALLLFGQKPDSIVRVFTDTYKHGLSQWDYMCDNVDCGGHFLCSVAANGHRSIVKPQRFGERGGGKIICNRQLLIANAFEELIEQRFPGMHKVIRRNYNKVGHVIHRYYGIFNNKTLADVIYLLMKPLEWIFLITLYFCDENPENRIAKQYLSHPDRKQLEEELNKTIRY
jgi:hypothetical protein